MNDPLAITLASMEAAIRRMEARFDRLEKVHVGLLSRKLTRAEQAKKAGCSRVALWRREQKLRMQALANGRALGA